VKTTSIVIFGTDPTLLQTRQMILENAGLPSTAVHGFGDAMRLIENTDAVLLILCSSLDHTTKDAFLDAANQTGKKNLKIMILTKSLNLAANIVDKKVLVTPVNPSTFIAKVRHELI
jgi:DNA-binding response OmpR family regulator